jgi:uncharacterized protein (TIGR02285 family)
MKRRLSFFIGVAASILWATTLCAGHNIIMWHQADFPPAFILQGEDAGTGYCNKMEKDVTAFLKEYEHRHIESNYKRITTALKDESNACCASIYKTPEREKFAAFSEPLFIGFSNGVIIPKEKVNLYEKYITPDKQIDLDALINTEKNIKIGIVSGRTYGPIEKIIAPFKGTEKIYERASTDSKGLVLMLTNNRIDILLALPMEIAYTAEQLGLGKEKMTFFPMKDGDLYTVSYMACTGNEWGKNVIEKINFAIEQKRPVFAKYYRDRLDNSSAKIYDALVEKVFGKPPAD